ncbi:MAG: DinG family ATP-dependent helicase YoaA [uncultured Thermomicrobiales bacterium]|uniref:3'-5' exonuclease DinG n=1 Tax=uncultured Thermomicrobiales bacterium TaxID=1645740 RepID=A0A6J4TNN6_9BACT|nr:MAG: DinG family ATP-dependent helicase YoaA [uncultured Thermomicrobiales bacterium]
MDPARGEIVEIAVVVFDRERELDRFSSLVRPRGALSLDIATRTGIDPAGLKDAPAFAEIAPALRRLLAGRPIIGHSVGLDVAMLDAAGMVLPNAVYDTYHLATLLLPELPAYNLGTVAGRLGVEPDMAHRALDDALTGAGVFRGLLAELDHHDPLTLEQVAVLARQAGWPSAALFQDAARRQPIGPLFATEGARGPHELAFLTPRERPEPLRRTGSRTRVEADAIRDLLAADGPLRGVVPGYERRPQQEAMASAVARAFNEDGQLLVEAGTGTGKSVAYLLPAVLHARERGEPVVVSTNTVALQDQLFKKDIPDLRRALGERDGDVPFRASVLKGRSNYLCLRRWFTDQRGGALDPVTAQLHAKVLLWLGRTETGDRAELRLEPEEEALWRNLSAVEDACVASRCVFQQRNQCFLYRARRNAEQAHVVVVNHALLLSDVMAGSRILPEYGRLVVDEAHHLEDQATAQFGYAIDERTIGELVDGLIRTEGALQNGTIPLVLSALLRETDEKGRRRASAALDRAKIALDRATGARTAARDLFARLAEFLVRHEGDGGGGGGGFDRTLRVTRSLRNDGGWIEVEVAWERLDRELTGLDEQARWFLEAVEQVAPGEDADDLEVNHHDDLVIALGAAIRAGNDLAARLTGMIGSVDANLVYWIERSPVLDIVSFHAAPVRVGDLLREELFGRLDTVVLTSATMATDGGFEFVADRLGLEDADELAVDSPFDYRRAALLYLATDMPEPNQPAYQRRLQEALIALCAATGGRGLVLFTSHAALQATYRAIKRPLEERGIVVLAQRTDGSPRQLVERLKHSPNVVLLGTSTFWEGVDVVGDALSLLVITKLPFAVPSDPVFAARSELFEQPFGDYAVPQAVLRFKQGFGRLIRSGRDRGVCAVLDRRVVSKRYGERFVQALPDCTTEWGGVADLPEAAQAWLAHESW